ncbi:hypothetical protein [Terricaulis sp.]|uniref:hypothetical protein n=1 Tax=Terricaulis sp. TaxID=2768686 RepID=UPI003784E939
MKTFGRAAAAVAIIGFCVAGPAQAQRQGPAQYPNQYQGRYDGRQIAPPQYGGVRIVFGEAMLVAEQQARCARQQDMLQPGICFTNALQAMRTAGLSQAPVIAIPFGQADGPVSGAVFDVSLAGAAATAAARSMTVTTVVLPRSCATLAGEAPRFVLENRGGLRVAQEQQLVVCGGAAPPGPPYQITQTPIPAAAPTPGARPAISGPTWPPAGTKVISGTSMPLASIVADCPPEAVLRDEMCFAHAVAQLNANPNLEQVVMLGVPAPASAGQFLADTAQYEIRRRRDRFNVHRRIFERSLLNAEDGCAPTGPMRFLVASAESGLSATPQLEERCGPPEATLGLALWEFYGENVFLATPGNCAASERLLGGGVCFSQAIAYLRESGDSAVQVVMIESGAARGASIGFGRANNLMVRAAPDFQSFTTEQVQNFEDGVRQPPGCQAAPSGNDSSRGVIVDNNQSGRFYRRFMCPVR